MKIMHFMMFFELFAKLFVENRFICEFNELMSNNTFNKELGSGS